jgi:sialic acid synthase SpsE
MISINSRPIGGTHLAIDSGADAVKFQLFEADRLMSRAAKLAVYQKSAGESDPISMLRRLELKIEHLAPCVTLAQSRGVDAIVSVFSAELVPIAQELPWNAYKTASPDIINLPLLTALANTGKPLIISTGASTPEEISTCDSWLSAFPNIAYLQCVSSYPTPGHMAELGGIPALTTLLPHRVIGYSDHTTGLSTGMDAVLMGARILEKHFTYSRSAAGPDHAASLDPNGFALYCHNVRSLPLFDANALASMSSAHRRSAELMSTRPPDVHAIKRVLPIEQDVRTVSRQSLTTTRPLPAGHILTSADLTIKRPGTGMPPHLLASVLGKPLTCAVDADVPLPSDAVRFT